MQRVIILTEQEYEQLTMYKEVVNELENKMCELERLANNKDQLQQYVKEWLDVE